MQIFAGDELAALAQAGPAAAAEFSPLGESSCLGVDLQMAENLPGRWLRALVCPVIGVGDAQSPGAADCDCIVADEAAAQQLAAQIAKNPVAATVFARLLRVTENMPLSDALEVESLAYASLQAGAEYAAWLAANQAEAPAQPGDEGPAVLMTREAEVLRLELNRASNRNAMSVEMRDALVESLALVIADPDIAQVDIRGRGPHFSTGGDLTEFGSVPDPAIGHLVRALSVPGRFLAQCASRVQVYVHGACVGSGIEFPAFAARICAAPDSFFQLPEVGMGLIPGAGGCISIARRIGRQRLAWMGLSGQRIDAQRALEWGLVDALAA